MAGEQSPSDEDAVGAQAPEPEGAVTLEGAARLLHEVFGSLLDADYLMGKTELRDTIAARFELSELAAEELCDDLERADRIRFVRTAEGTAWHIPGEPPA